MIKNERQYRVTQTQIHEFEQALATMVEASERMKQENLLLWQIQAAAIKSQLNDLKKEIQQ
jgi:hypothetical protein